MGKSSRTSFRITLATGGLAAIMATLAASPALAERQSDPVVITARAVADGALIARVSYADLNLRSEAGLARLNARVRSAVPQICPDVAGLDLRGNMINAQCRRSAFDQAASQIAELTSHQLAGGGGSISIAVAR